MIIKITFFVVPNKKLLRRTSDTYLYIYTLHYFVELENNKELYIKFFKHQPYMIFVTRPYSYLLINEYIQNILTNIEKDLSTNYFTHSYRKDTFKVNIRSRLLRMLIQEWRVISKKSTK